MAELQPAIDKNTASDTPVPTASPSPSSVPTSNLNPPIPACAAKSASAKDDLPTKTSWDEDELELNEYHLLGANPPPRQARKKRKSAHECFGKVVPCLFFLGTQDLARTTPTNALTHFPKKLFTMMCLES